VPTWAENFPAKAGSRPARPGRGTTKSLFKKEERMADWIPAREQDFNELCEYWNGVLPDPAKITAFGWETAECTRVAGIITAYTIAWQEYHGANTTANRLAKDEAKDRAIAAMRDFAQTSIRYNKKMSDPEKLPFGLSPADHEPSPQPPPHLRPVTIADTTLNHYEHKVSATDPVSGGHKKPEGVHGLTFARQVGGTRPASAEAIADKEFQQSPVRVYTYGEADKGQTAYYATVYENRRGQKGPWSDIVEVIIA
jgi:hypothetical protein